jgi:hypothetical protein
MNLKIITQIYYEQGVLSICLVKSTILKNILQNIKLVSGHTSLVNGNELTN